MYGGNLFSERVQGALEVLHILMEDGSGEEGMTVTQIYNECRMYRKTLNSVLLTLREGGILKYRIAGRNGRLSLNKNLCNVTMYDIVNLMDGAVHIGEPVRVVAAMRLNNRKSRLSNWEDKIKRDLSEMLRGIKFTDFLSLPVFQQDSLLTTDYNTMAQ